jgi:hypothetical protein
MPPTPPTIRSGPVTVTFHWVGDRWAHEVDIHGLGTWRSIEGPRAGGDDRWPAAPVLVELAPLETPHGLTILGVGLAGRSHFSASIGPAAGQHGRLRFEIACRIVESPVWLGSTYASCGKTGGEVVMAPAAGQPPKLPATVQWAYSFGAAGLAPCDRPGN